METHKDGMNFVGRGARQLPAPSRSLLRCLLLDAEGEFRDSRCGLREAGSQSWKFGSRNREGAGGLQEIPLSARLTTLESTTAAAA